MLYVALFFVAWLAVLAANGAPPLRRVAGPTVAMAALTLAALRGYSTDYDGYVELFDALALFEIPYPERLFLAKEPLMSLLIDGILWLRAGPQWMFVVMALASVLMKQHLFARLYRGNTAAAWAVTLSLTFFLHEYTQSRVAIAIAASFFALVAVLDGRRTAWLGWCLLGIGWHLSVLQFMALTSVLWLPQRWRVPAGAAVTAASCAVMLVAFEWLGSVDLRLAEYGNLTTSGVSGLTFAIVALKLLMLAAMARWLVHAPVSRALEPLVMPTLGLVVAGVVMLLVLRSASSVIAFRFYEFFDAFAVFIVAGALLQRRPLPVLTALAYCVLGIALQYLPDLFKDFVWAPWSRYAG